MTSPERTRGNLLPRGFTLVEVMVASALSVAVLLGLWNVWSQAARQTARLSGGNEQMQELRLGCKRVMNELQEGLALYYPQPGGQTQSGLSFLNAQGAVVAYHEALSEDGSSRSIRRYDFTADTDEEGLAHLTGLGMPFRT